MESGFSGLTELSYNNILLLVWVYLSLVRILLTFHFNIFNILRMLDTHSDAFSDSKLDQTRYDIKNTAKKVKMEPVNDTEDRATEKPSKATKVAQSIWRFCSANWLIFAFGFATLMAYLFPREHTVLPWLMSTAC